MLPESHWVLFTPKDGDLQDTLLSQILRHIGVELERLSCLRTFQNGWPDTSHPFPGRLTSACSSLFCLFGACNCSWLWRSMALLGLPLLWGGQPGSNKTPRDQGQSICAMPEDRELASLHAHSMAVVTCAPPRAGLVLSRHRKLPPALSGHGT